MQETMNQDHTTLSKSAIWQSNHAFFADGGNQVWKQVPHHVTNAPYHARRTAQLVASYWQELLKTGIAISSEPFYLLEIGSGIGKFAALFVRELKDQLIKAGLTEIHFTFILTDISQQVIDRYQKHPSLTPLVQTGHVDFALYDLLADTEITLINRNIRLKDPANPLVSIANYVLCSLPQDYFKIENRKLFIGKIPAITLPENTYPNQYFTLETLGFPVQYEAINNPYKEEFMNRYLIELEQKVDLGYFIYPKSSVRGLSNLLSHISKKMLFILSDKGFATDTGLRAMEEIGFTMHGQGFSFPVDYKAIGKYTEFHHGSSIYQSIEQDLSTAVYSFGHQLEQLPTYIQQAKEVLDLPSSGDLIQLFHEIPGNTSVLSWNSLISLLKVSYWDPEIFSMLFPSLTEYLPNISSLEINKLLRALPLIERNYYPYPGCSDFHFQAGSIFRKIGQNTSAIAHFKQSLAIEGEKEHVLQTLSRCYLEENLLSEAAETAGKVLLTNPNHLEMLGILTHVEKALKQDAF